METIIEYFHQRKFREAQKALILSSKVLLLLQKQIYAPVVTAFSKLISLESQYFNLEFMDKQNVKNDIDIAYSSIICHFIEGSAKKH
jgi:hypothetical protein